MKAATKSAIPVKSQQKICEACKRSFTNRKRWASRGIWEEIKYCSDQCRKMKQNPAFLAKHTI